MDQSNICKFSTNRSSDLICTNFIYETQEGQAVPRRSVEYMIGLVAGGEGYLILSHHRHALHTGDLFFISPSDFFSVNSPTLSYFYICYHGRRADEFAQRFALSRDRCVFHGYEALIPFWRSCQEIAGDKNIDLLCESVLLYSLANIAPAESVSSDILSTMIALTQEQFTQANLSLAVIAKQIGYSPKYLSAFFKKKKGISYSQYLRDMRLRHAVFLMEEGLVSVKSIALLSGFHDPLYFSKVFTSSEGISPKAYITSVQKKETDT